MQDETNGRCSGSNGDDWVEIKVPAGQVAPLRAVLADEAGVWADSGEPDLAALARREAEAVQRGAVGGPRDDIATLMGNYLECYVDGYHAKTLGEDMARVIAATGVLRALGRPIVNYDLMRAAMEAAA